MSILPAWYIALSKIPLPECIHYKDNWIGPMFILIDYYPILVTATIIVMSLYRAELMFRIMSLFMTADAFINWGLRELIGHAGGSPSRLLGCGNEFEMPSFATQHLAFMAYVIQFMMLKRRKPVDMNVLIMLHLMVFAGNVARVYIGINSLAELYVGTVVGTVEGLLVTPILLLLIRNRDKIVKWSADHNWPLLSFEDTLLG